MTQEYKGKKPSKFNQLATKEISTGALWHLSLILADIARQNPKKENRISNNSGVKRK